MTVKKGGLVSILNPILVGNPGSRVQFKKIIQGMTAALVFLLAWSWLGAVVDFVFTGKIGGMGTGIFTVTTLFFGWAVLAVGGLLLSYTALRGYPVPALLIGGAVVSVHLSGVMTYSEMFDATLAPLIASLLPY